MFIINKVNKQRCKIDFRVNGAIRVTEGDGCSEVQCGPITTIFCTKTTFWELFVLTDRI